MKHLFSLPTLFIGATSATVAFALGETRVPVRSPEAAVQQSAVVDGADNFYRSDKVAGQKVTFKDQYRMKVAGNPFIPKASNPNGKWPAIVPGTRWAP